MRKILLAAACLVGLMSFAFNAQAAPAPKAPQDVNVTNSELDVNVLPAGDGYVFRLDPNATESSIDEDFTLPSDSYLTGALVNILLVSGTPPGCVAVLQYLNLNDVPTGQNDFFIFDTASPTLGS